MRRAGMFLIALAVLIAASAAFVFSRVIVLTMPGESYRGALPPLSPAQAELARQLERDVRALAGDIGERNLFRHGSLDRSARYIEEALKAAGHAVARQSFIVRGVRVSNVEARIPGKDSESGIVVIGAHYDSVRGSAGANDNASGVAALLALGRALEGRSFRRDMRLVAFVNEEMPFSNSESMGSVHYARRLAAQGQKVAAMVSLETIGYYVDGPGTQRYPFPLAYFYPDTGNFIAFVGNPASKNQVQKMVGAFRETASFPSEGLAAPDRIAGVGWSDHWSFWQQGMSAVMVTDTALYRYREYHTPKDTPDILIYDRFARVVEGLIAVTVDLAEGE